MTYIGKVEEDELVFTPEQPPVVEPGVYIGTLVGMRLFSYETPEGETRKLIEWKFTAKDGSGTPLVDDSGKVLELSGVTSLSSGSLSKRLAWTVALVGAAAAAPDARIGPDALIGKQAQIAVGPDKKGYPKVQALTAMLRTRAAAPAPAPLHDDDLAAPAPIRPPADGKVPGTTFDDLPF